MPLKDKLESKKGTLIELLFFFVSACSTLPMFITGPILYGLGLSSLGIRKTEWKDIGFAFADFTLKRIGIGIVVAIAYYFAHQYVIDPLLSAITQPGLPEIFSMKGNILKLAIGLTLSWTTAAFFEEILFRGYLINRFIDLTGDGLVAKISIVLLSGLAFGFVHCYQGLYGAMSAGIIGIFQATVYFLARKKLAIPIIAHGVYDTIGFTLLFIG